MIQFNMMFVHAWCGNGGRFVVVMFRCHLCVGLAAKKLPSQIDPFFSSHLGWANSSSSKRTDNQSINQSNRIRHHSLTHFITYTLISITLGVWIHIAIDSILLFPA